MTDRTATTRPTVVTTGVWLMYASLVVAVVGAAIPTLVRIDDVAMIEYSVATLVIGNLIGLAWLAFLAWGTRQMGRGSDRARFWLSVWAALGLLGMVGTVITHSATVFGSLQIALAVAAMVCVRLPSARPFFPHTPRGTRRPAAPPTVGWDPDTGERITAPRD